MVIELIEYQLGPDYDELLYLVVSRLELHISLFNGYIHFALNMERFFSLIINIAYKNLVLIWRE